MNELSTSGYERRSLSQAGQKLFSNYIVHQKWESNSSLHKIFMYYLVCMVTETWARTPVLARPKHLYASRTCMGYASCELTGSSGQQVTRLSLCVDPWLSILICSSMLLVCVNATLYSLHI